MQDVTRHLIISWKTDDNLLTITDPKLCYSCIVKFESQEKLIRLVKLKDINEKESWASMNWLSYRTFWDTQENDFTVYKIHLN